MLGSLGLLGLQPARDPAADCAALLAAARLEEAALRCAETFGRTGDPRAGLAAGKALLELGDTEAALAWAERFIDGAEAADAWRLAAQVHHKRGDLMRLKAAVLRELPLRRAGGDHTRVAELTYWGFWFAIKEANYSEALEFARQSLRAAVSAADQEKEYRALQAFVAALIEIGDLEGANGLLPAMINLLPPGRPVEQARLLNFKGLYLVDTARPAQARDAFESAIRLASPSADRNEDALQILRSSEVNLIKAYLALGDNTKAEQHLEEARRYEAKPAALLFYRGRLLQARGQLAEAAEVLASALERNLDGSWAREVALRLGMVEEERGDLASAEAAYSLARGLVDQMFATAGSDGVRAVLTDDNRRPFEALVRLCVRSGRLTEAIELVEEVRSRTFLGAFLSASAPGTCENGSAASALREVDERLAAITTLLPLASESPLVAPRPLKETLKQLGSRRVLSYLESGEELWLFELSAGRIEAQRLDASLSHVRELIERFRQFPDDPATSGELGAILLPHEVLPSPGPLFIAPDGVLGEVSFAALRRNGRFLVEDYSVAYVPSASVLAAIETRPSGPPDDAIVVLADPRGDLAEAALEARQVAGQFGVIPYLAAAATLPRLREAARADVLHLGTHAGLRTGGAWLALGDGDVMGEQVMAERIGPRLVVLASCSSAARVGKSMWGSLGAAFLVAGSRTVVASLGSVEDSATRELITWFYDRGGVDRPAEALAAAQRELIAAGWPVSTWAPFLVIGSDHAPGRPTERKEP